MTKIETTSSDRSNERETVIQWQRVVLIVVFFIILLGAFYIAGRWVDSSVAEADRLSIKIGVNGLLATLGGFAFTFWQLYHTSTVADSTERAIQRIKSDFQSLDVVVELSNARNEARRTQERLHESHWALTANAYAACRSSLDKCVAAGTGLDNGEIESLKDYQAKFIFAENLMNQRSLSDGVEVKVETLSGDLTDFSSFINHLEYTIRSRFGDQ